MNVAVIPARGGSKRIPKKNIKLFHGKPIIQYSIEAAMQSGLFDSIIVSTDCDEIAEVAEKVGAKVPFKRPASLSDDYVGTQAVVAHAAKWCREALPDTQNICCIYPTAPLLLPSFLKESFELLEKEKSDFVFSVTTFPFPPQRGLLMDQNGFVSARESQFIYSRSQDLDECFHDAGQFYFSRAESVRRGSLLTNSKVKLQMLHRNSVIDIDTLEDFEIAEEKLSMRKKNSIDKNWMF